MPVALGCGGMGGVLGTQRGFKSNACHSFFCMRNVPAFELPRAEG